jgi:Golgi SNAP receptor complex protein 1
MAQVVDGDAGGSNTSMMHILQRHRDIYYDYSKEFKKTKVLLDMMISSNAG